MRTLDMLFLLGSNVLTLIMVYIVNGAKAELLRCSGAIDFGRALSRAQSRLMTPQTLATGVRQLIAKNGGMAKVHSLHDAAKGRIEKSDLQVLHYEIESSVERAPHTSLESAALHAVVDDTGDATTKTSNDAGVTRAPSDLTASTPPLSRAPPSPKSPRIKKKKSLSDVEFDHLVVLYNKVVKARKVAAKCPRKFTLTDSEQLLLEQQVTDYRILTLSDFDTLLGEIVAMRS